MVAGSTNVLCCIRVAESGDAVPLLVLTACKQRGTNSSSSSSSSSEMPNVTDIIEKSKSNIDKNPSE